MKKLIFQMESMLICLINQKSACSVIIGIFQIRALAMDHIFVMDAITCYNMQKCNKLKNIAIAHIKENVYITCFLYMSKCEAKELMNNSNLINKKGVL